MTTIFNGDYETYSELDLFKTGAHKYAMHDSTEVLMLGYSFDHGPVDLWVPAEGQPMPVILKEAFEELTFGDGIEFHAFNAGFERLISRYVLGIEIPIERFRCTMIHAWSLSFSGGLANVGEQMGMAADKRKNARGKQLINKFSKPAPSNHKADRYGYWNAPEDWQEFKDYCVQDVIAEREIELLLAGYPMNPEELELWFWDQEVNDRGIPVDVDLVNACVDLEKEEKALLKKRMNEVSGLDNANSNTQMLAWLQGRGVQLDNMQAETVKKTIAKVEDPVVEEVLQLKALVSKTSTKKWQAFQNAVCYDGMLRGMFQFGGAQRTQRWAGRIVQLQNLKRPSKDLEAVIDKVVDVFLTRDLDVCHAVFDNVLDVLSQGVRCAITAPEGYLLTPCDLSSIESRVLGYVAGCTRINQTFAEGKDTYKDFAMEFYQIAYDMVTKEQRFFCKPPTLGCGYQLGWKGLIEYADSMGVAMTEEQAQQAVKVFRDTYPEVKAMWYWLVEACTDVIENWTVKEGYCVRIYRDQNFMFIELPNGRRLAYYQPLVVLKVPPWERDRVEEEISALAEEDLDIEEFDSRQQEIKASAKKRPTISYMGMNQFSKRWERITTHGGKLTENIVQAIARDVLAFHMRKAEEKLGPIIRGHVHDEMIPVVSEQYAPWYLEQIEQVMSITPPWLPGFMVSATGFITKRYKKD